MKCRCLCWPLRFRSWYYIGLAILLVAGVGISALWSTFIGRYNYVPSMLQDELYAPTPVELNKFFPHAEPKDRHTWNYQALLDLHTCTALRNCGPNQQKVAVLAAHWFEESYFFGFRGGEGIWAFSLFNSLRALGYTILLANDFKEAQEVYKQCPDLVKIVVRNHARDCYTDNSCVKNPGNPRGIPAWKIFDFEYYPNFFGDRNPNEYLDYRWMLSGMPNPLSKKKLDNYIGFSLEPSCTKFPVIPLSARTNTIWLFMKQLSYIYFPSFTWSITDFHKLTRDLSVSITGAWRVEENYMRDRTNIGPDDKMEDIADPDKGIINLGRLDQDGFLDHLREARVMLAIGNPTWSPSPFEALCLGVPIVHPYWKRHDGAIEYQNWVLEQYGPPYVYHVEAHNYKELHDAVKLASETPINRFIPKFMTEAALRDRLVNLMETDWRSEAEVLMSKRMNMTDVYTFEL